MGGIQRGSSVLEGCYGARNHLEGLVRGERERTILVGGRERAILVGWEGEGHLGRVGGECPGRVVVGGSRFGGMVQGRFRRKEVVLEGSME